MPSPVTMAFTITGSPTVELTLAFLPLLEAMAGKSWPEVVRMYAALDADAMADPRDRQLIEAARAMVGQDLGEPDGPLAPLRPPVPDQPRQDDQRPDDHERPGTDAE